MALQDLTTPRPPNPAQAFPVQRAALPPRCATQGAALRVRGDQRRSQHRDLPHRAGRAKAQHGGRARCSLQERELCPSATSPLLFHPCPFAKLAAHRPHPHTPPPPPQATLKHAFSDSPFELKVPEFSVRPGELVAVVGRVGAGKSSLLQAILGNMELVRGRAVAAAAPAYASCA
jgi:hypothetical protein